MTTLRALGANESAVSYPVQTAKNPSSTTKKFVVIHNNSKLQNSTNSFCEGLKNFFKSFLEMIIKIFTCACFRGGTTSKKIAHASVPASPGRTPYQRPNKEETISPSPSYSRKPSYQPPATVTESKRHTAPFIQKPVSVLEAHCNRLAHMADTLPVIRFYDNDYNADTAFMGNFYIAPFTIEGYRFQTMEAYFHAKKHWHNKAIVQQFADCKDGDAALALNRKFKMTPQQLAEWDGTPQNPGKKILVMYEGLKAKFTQNPHLKALLLSTKIAKLSEFNTGKGKDAYWSTGPDGKGLDKLGELMMAIRTYFQLPPE